MASSSKSEAQRIRASLTHPVIDADGHWLEFGPIIIEQLEKFGGSRAVEGFRSFNGRVSKRLTSSEDDRKRRRRAQEAFWALPTKNTRDRATEILPRLLYERLDEFGMDFTVLYPTAGLGIPFHPDDETRRATCRAFNRFIAEFFGEFSDRMTPAAVIPMHTPEEACRRTRARREGTRAESRDDGEHGAAPDTGGIRGRGAIRDLVRHARARQRVRLRSGVGEMRRAGNLADVSFGIARHRACAFRRPISFTTTSGISPPPARRSARRFS